LNIVQRWQPPICSELSEGKNVPQKKMTITTAHGQGLYEFTSEAERFVTEADIDEGLLTVFVRHTSCSLLIQENADPDVRRDLTTFFSRLVPPSDDASMRWVIHTLEGPDDMPAHIKSALTAVSIGVPISGGRLVLGTWQGLYLFEHRDRPHRREVVLHISP
jgi:secondary thiamine-phosphate synthase enzyme